MQEKDIYEYAVIRIVPRVEREEFVNTGVLLYCPKKKYLGIKYHLPKEKIALLHPETDLEEIASHLKAMEEIAGGISTSPIASLDIASRFRWLSATRSTVVQTSKVHPGFCHHSPAATLQKLFEELVA